MSEQTVLELAPNILFQDLDGEAVFLNLSDDNYYGLDEVGTFIWKLLTEHGDLEFVVAQVLKEFESDEVTVRRDIEALIDQLRQAGLATAG